MQNLGIAMMGDAFNKSIALRKAKENQALFRVIMVLEALAFCCRSYKKPEHLLWVDDVIEEPQSDTQAL